ncbi:hypothetical protein [Duganella sp. BuS-21]|uniref:hypothetical protein n=1 Tax=Duganella sp. BuS-21 TaxID=2943848 RepID=UPI0035A6F7B7
MDAKESNLLDQFLSSLTEATGFRLGRVEHDVPDSYADRHRGIDALVELFPPDNMPSIELAVEIRNSDL